MLKLKTRKKIIEYEGKGGATTAEQKDLERMLSGKIYEMTQADVFRQIDALKNEAKKQLESHKKVLDYVDNKRAVYRATPNLWPTRGHVTSRYGYRLHPFLKTYDKHTGIDIANLKNTPIYATGYGKVRLCDWTPGYGRLIVIDHGYGYRTYYGHLEKILVKPGDKIVRGQLIGLMGDTGTSTGYHLHYEIRYRRRTVNPKYFLKRSLDRYLKNKKG